MGFLDKNLYKFKNGDIWHGIDNVKDGISYYVTKSGELGDFAFKEVGTYKVYWDTTASGEPAKSIWIQKRFLGEVKVGGEVVQKASFDFNKIEGKVLEYKILEAPLSAGVSVSVSFNSVVKSITVEEGGAKEDFEVTETSLTLIAGTNVKYDFYLKESTETGALSMYVAKTPAPVTVTVTCQQDFAFRDQIPLFAWVWGDGNTGSWVKIEFVAPADSVSFTVPTGCQHFLLVRCSVGTETPNWNTKGDDAGRIYNKTEDKDLSEGVTNYQVTFVDYIPA